MKHLLLLSAMLFSSATGTAEEVDTTASIPATAEAISARKIARVDFDNVNLHMAFVFVAQKLNAKGDKVIKLRSALPKSVMSRRVTIQCRDMTPVELIDRCLKGVDYLLEIGPGVVVIWPDEEANKAQQDKPQ